MTSNETQMQTFADWPTLDKGQQEKSKISCHCRDKETTDRQNVPPEKS